MSRKPLIAVVTPYRETLMPAYWFSTWLPIRERRVEMNLLARLKRDIPDLEYSLDSWMEQQDYFCLPLINRHMTNDMPHISAARNQLVEAALHRQADYIYWLDSDEVIRKPRDSWEALKLLYEAVQRPEVDIVTGMYIAKNSRKLCAVRRNKDTGEREFIPVEEARGRLTEVDSTGFGCVLTPTKIFTKLEYPWFVSDTRSMGFKMPGEDTYFSYMARAAGYHIWMHGDVEFSHLGIFQLTVDGELEKAI